MLFYLCSAVSGNNSNQEVHQLRQELEQLRLECQNKQQELDLKRQQENSLKNTENDQNVGNILLLVLLNMLKLAVFN